jgi:hypothetical protein
VRTAAPLAGSLLELLIVLWVTRPLAAPPPEGCASAEDCDDGDLYDIQAVSIKGLMVSWI